MCIRARPQPEFRHAGPFHLLRGRLCACYSEASLKTAQAVERLAGWGTWRDPRHSSQGPVVHRGAVRLMVRAPLQHEPLPWVSAPVHLLRFAQRVLPDRGLQRHPGQVERPGTPAERDRL